MRWFVGAVPALFPALYLACGSFSEAGTPADAAAPIPVDAADGGSVGDGGVDAPRFPAVTCQKGQVFCRATNACLGNCLMCPNAETACYVCNTAQKEPVGTCEPTATAYCLAGDYANAYPDGGGR